MTNNHPNRSTRAQLFEHDPRHVTLVYTDDLGERVERDFWIPNVSGSAYVREGDRQVCVGLRRLGNTLTVGPRQRLIDVIRAEWRAARRELSKR